MADQITIGEFWGAQGMRAIGSAIVTAKGPAGPAGFLALSATHLTASPPIMTVAIMPSTSALSAIRHSGAFAINYLTSGAQGTLARFAGANLMEGSQRFCGLECAELVTESPILPGIVGAMDCKLLREESLYGAYLLYGEILATWHDLQAQPLIHFGGKVVGP